MKDVNIFTVADGALVELFDEAWRQVLENIGDPNTEAEAVRRISLEISVVPSEDRSLAAVSVRPKVKLAATQGHSSAVFLSRDGSGRVVARQPEGKQQGLFEKEDRDPKVREIGGKDGR
jgi:hypothetical protein